MYFIVFSYRSCIVVLWFDFRSILIHVKSDSWKWSIPQLELCWFAQSMSNQIQTFDRSNPFGTLHLKIMTFPSHMLHNWYTTTTHTDIQDERWQVCLCWWGYLSDEPRSIGKHVIVDVCVFHLHGSVLVVAINYQSESYNKRSGEKDMFLCNPWCIPFHLYSRSYDLWFKLNSKQQCEVVDAGWMSDYVFLFYKLHFKQCLNLHLRRKKKFCKCVF